MKSAGFGLLGMLVGVAMVSVAGMVMADSLATSAKTHRDRVSNAEITALFDRIQKIVGTEWSCTASLSGSNSLAGVVIHDPVASGLIVAGETTLIAPFWGISRI